LDHNTLKQNTARLSIISNTALVIFKLAVGLAGGAVSIVSEAAHSAVDLIAACIAYFAVRKAAKPPDAHHAYGHGKVENLSAAAEAALIVLAALWIVYEAADKLATGHTPAYLEYGIAVMAVSVAVNQYVSAKLMKVAKLTGSHALEADALHLKADIWTSCGVLSGLVVIKITGLAWLDPAIAIAVAAVVFKAGYTMTKKSLYELTDVSLPPEEEELIKTILTAHPEILAFHQLRTRRSGSLRLIDVHVILPRDIHLDVAHAICDEVEAALEESLAPCEATIHLEPCTCPDK
jgi:cation diffusion facilitator family transporter